jgi:hypothetical protein
MSTYGLGPSLNKSLGYTQAKHREYLNSDEYKRHKFERELRNN